MKQAKRLTRKEKIELSKKLGIDLRDKSQSEIRQRSATIPMSDDIQMIGGDVVRVADQRQLSDDLDDIARKCDR